MKINIGAGATRYNGFVNCDHSSLFNPEYVFDLETDVFPFEDNSVDEVIAYHVLEHLGEGYFHCLQELYRVCKKDAIIKIRVPHFLNENMYHDPTHRRPITPVGLNLFNKKLNLASNSAASKLGLQYNVDFEVIRTHNHLNGEHPRISDLTQMPPEILDAYAFDRFNIYAEVEIDLRVIK